MSPALQEMLREARGQSVVLDSNLLLLWITSQHNPALLRSFKRVQKFSFEDATLLAWLIDHFGGLVTTPHVMTEVSNLANGLSSWARIGWFETLAEFARETPEVFAASDSLSQLPEFVLFGVADAALSDLSRNYWVLTMDGRLSGHLGSTGRPCLNFAELRMLVS